MACNYHDVIIGDSCIALVYDTRYEDGQQFLPPDRGTKKMGLHLPKEDKKFTISSMGMQFSIGVLDVIMLVLHQDEPEGPPSLDAEVGEGV